MKIRLERSRGGRHSRRLPWMLPALAVTGWLLTGCANLVMLHPQIARNAAARWPVDPARFGDVPEVSTVTNAFGHELTGWVFASPTNHGVLLVDDGNATGIAQTCDYNRYLLRQGFNLVVLSYQGFDTNSGGASVAALPGDIQSFYDFCRQRFPGQPVALVGESISAGTFFCFGSRHPEIAAMVLEGTVDLKRVAYTKLRTSWVFCLLFPITAPSAVIISAQVPDDLSAQRALQRHPVIPALFIHRPEDPVTPYRDARRIFEQYPGAKEFIIPQIDRGRGFHMTAMSKPEVRAQVMDFLKRNLVSEPIRDAGP